MEKLKSDHIVNRKFNNHIVRQDLQTEYICASDITDIYNQVRISEGKSPKELKKYFQNKDSKEFMKEVCNELNSLEKNSVQNMAFYSESDLKYVRRGKHNRGTWLHPYVFVDYAMWLNPRFRAKVVIWITDNLLGYRNSGGVAFKKTNKAIDKKFGPKTKPWVYANVSTFIQELVFGKKVNDNWKNATEDQQRKRDVLLTKMQALIEYGNYNNVYDVMKHMRKMEK